MIQIKSKKICGSSTDLDFSYQQMSLYFEYNYFDVGFTHECHLKHIEVLIWWFGIWEKKIVYSYWVFCLWLFIPFFYISFALSVNICDQLVYSFSFHYFVVICEADWVKCFVRIYKSEVTKFFEFFHYLFYSKDLHQWVTGFSKNPVLLPSG